MKIVQNLLNHLLHIAFDTGEDEVVNLMDVRKYQEGVLNIVLVSIKCLNTFKKESNLKGILGYLSSFILERIAIYVFL